MTCRSVQKSVQRVRKWLKRKGSLSAVLGRVKQRWRDNLREVTGMTKARWTVAEAKAKFSEVLERAEKEGPQRITKHGRETAVVVSAEDWAQKNKRKGTLVEFFMNSPLRGSGLEIPPRKKSTRRIEL